MPGFFVCLRRTVCPTPTCVGNTTCSPCSGTTTAVHPHMRGEYGAGSVWRAAATGSSPHAWGIPLPSSRYNSWARFIPTCVGNTACGRKPFTKKSVHPHMRGEYAQEMSNRTGKSGSSPHAWGIPQADQLEGCGLRFIPTCVGNTTPGRSTGGRRTVHPHMRGEYKEAVA